MCELQVRPCTAHTGRAQDSYFLNPRMRQRFFGQGSYCIYAHLAKSVDAGAQSVDAGRFKDCAMEAVPVLASVEQIIEMHAKLEGLKLVMADRRHGGAGKSGRYLKHDTARLHFIDGQALRDLAGGLLPSAENHRALFDIAGDLEIQGTAQQKDMDMWYDKHYADPRSKKHADAGLSKLRQTSLLAWVGNNAAAFARPRGAPPGVPLAYKLGFGPYAGYTLMDLVRDGNKGKLTWAGPLPPAGKVSGGPHLLWMCSSLDFRFPEHTRLFLGLLQFERDGVIVLGNGRVAEHTVDASRARRAYAAWAKPSLDHARAAVAGTAAGTGSAAASGAGVYFT